MYTNPALARRNQATKPTAPSYPPHAAPTPPKGKLPAASGSHNPNQRPYLAAEMVMMQDTLKTAALKTAEIIRYMNTVRRVHGSSQAKHPPPTLANELRSQLMRYDQLCDIVESRLVRAHAALSARLARERTANPRPSVRESSSTQIDPQTTGDVSLSRRNIATPLATSSKAQYIAPPKSHDLSSLAAQRLHTTSESDRIISPVTLASSSVMSSTFDSLPSHLMVIPELMNALRRQEQEQARNALHQPQAQEVAPIDIFGVGAGSSMDGLFMDDTNPTSVDLDINSTVAGIDPSVDGLGPSVADIDEAVSAIHSAVPGMDSAVTEMVSVSDLDSSDALFGGLNPHANPTGDGKPKDGLLANFDVGEHDDMDLEMSMNLMDMGALNMGTGELGHADGATTGTGGMGIDGGAVDINAGDLGMDDIGIGGMSGDDIEAIWMGGFPDIGSSVHIKAEPE